MTFLRIAPCYSDGFASDLHRIPFIPRGTYTGVDYNIHLVALYRILKKVSIILHRFLQIYFRQGRKIPEPGVIATLRFRDNLFFARSGQVPEVFKTQRIWGREAAATA